MIESVSREPLANVDAAWRHMEEETNLMMVTGIMHFEGRVEIDDLKRILEHRLRPYKRFHQRVVDVGYRKIPHWEDDPEFDIGNHLTSVRLPEPADETALKNLASELSSVSLDFNRPLWHFHFVENLGSSTALIARLHHCIADGMALMGVLLSLTGKTAEESLESEGGRSNAQPDRLDSSGKLMKLAGGTLDAAGRAGSKIIDRGVKTVARPSSLMELARKGTTGAKTAASLVVRGADPQTIFKGPLGIPKRVAWSDPVSLEDVKALRRITNTTVNDILLTAMSGSLCRYLKGRGQLTQNLNFRAAVPVNLRPPDRIMDLGNQFGLVFLPLPVGVEDHLDRLWELQRRMDYLKKSGEAAIVFGIMKAVGKTPAEIQKILVNLFGTKATCVMTNVPGPPEALYMAGRKIESIMFWVPRSGRLGLGISILSYAGKIRLGVASDEGLVADPETIVANFHSVLDEMGELVRQVQ